MGVTLFVSLQANRLGRAKHPVWRVEAKGLKVRMPYTFECQYANPINTACNGSLPQANAGDIFIAAPLV